MSDKTLAIAFAGMAIAGGVYLAVHREPTLGERVVDAVGSPFDALGSTIRLLPWVVGGAVLVAAVVAVRNPNLVVGAIK